MKWIDISSVFTLIGAKNFITCPIEEYVRVGLEFQNCQANALSPDTLARKRGKNELCPNFKKIIRVCSRRIKHCFEDQAYERGLQITLDSMLINFPESQDCGYIAKMRAQTIKAVEGNHENTMCSIDREIELTQEMRICANGIHSDMLSHFDGQKTQFTHLRTQKAKDAYFRDMMCQTAKEIRGRCYVPKLKQCYDDYDAKAQLALHLEHLRMEADVIAISTSNVTDFADDCDVFESMFDGSPNKNSNVIIGVVIAALLLLLMAAVGVVVKFRLVTRFRAWLGNAPYDDMEANVGQASNKPTSSGIDPNIRAMERRSSENSNRSDN